MAKKAAFLLVTLISVMGLVVPARAQITPSLRLGYDTTVDAALIGVGIRFPMDLIEDFALVGVPSFEYFFVDDVEGVSQTILQVNFTALHGFEWEDQEQIIPYAGAGIGLQYSSLSFEDPVRRVPRANLEETETSLVINLVGGATYALDEDITPFGQLRLSLGGVYGDAATLMVGALFNL